MFSQPRKRKYVSEDVETHNTELISDNKVIIVKQNNNQLLQTILNNQLQLQQNLAEIQDNQNKKLKHLSSQIHNLQININNFETVIPTIVKDKLKDSIGEILFILQDTHNYPNCQEDNYYQIDNQNNSSHMNYVL